jgi:hypothetical protein
MELRCLVCGNKSKFTAEAKANVHVIIDGKGNLLSPRPAQQSIVKDAVILIPWKCNSCGAVDRIEDLEKKGTNEDAADGKDPEN